MPTSLAQPPGCADASPCEPLHHHAAWDAGDLGCGELILELSVRMRKMQAGEVLRLTAHDLGAPADIPAWCRMTGHTLLQFDPATQSYFIRRS